MIDKNELYGLILAGGKSSRMGFDKRLIEINNVTQQEYLFNLLEKFCSKVFLSCKQTHEIPSHFNPLADQFELDSPLNGILTAFKLHPEKSWLIVAVDMPLVSEHAITTLLNNRNAQCVATCFIDSEDKFPEPMLCLWEPTAHEPLQDFYKQGYKSPRQFLQQHKINLIKSHDKSTLTNVNTLDELKKIKRTD